MEKIGNIIYKDWNDYCGDVLKSGNLGNFKEHPKIEYMTEHNVLDMYAGEWIKQINEKLKILNIKLENALNVVLKNERIGGSRKNIKLSNGDEFCNANSIKYLNIALDIILDWRVRELEKIRVIEIGGGYGGFSLILQELVKECVGLKIVEYIMVDIDNVLKLQKRYLDENGLVNGMRYIEGPEFMNVKLDGGEEGYYIFSSYSYAEIDKEISRGYNEVFRGVGGSGVIGGRIYWNRRDVDIEGYDYKVEIEKPLTGKDNKIVTFYKPK